MSFLVSNFNLCVFELPKEFKLDYELMWQKLVLDKINLLESIDEMKIQELLNPNKTLDCNF